VRLTLAAVAAVLGFYSVTFSLAQVIVDTQPELAHQLAPYDGRITAALAASLSGPEASEADRRRADGLARLALRQDPTAVAAVTALGLNAAVRGDTAAARRLFLYSQKLSRRNLPTQLWLIEDAVERGDVPGALKHYDIALRVHPTMSELLFPVLATASSDPAIRAELIRTLAGRPAWGEGFINFVAGNGPDPRSTATLLAGLRRAGVAVPQPAYAGAVNALLAAGQLDRAWAFYASVRPGADRRRSRDPRFTANPEPPSQLDWVPINDGTISSSIQRGEGGGIFDFAAPPSTGGPMLQQLQLLPAGAYRLSGHSSGIDQSANALPYWTLSCKDGEELGRVVVPNSGEAGGNFFGSFTVPAGCPMQTLTLVARPSDVPSGLSGQIDRVLLEPVR
jgi:hypothetical protein